MKNKAEFDWVFRQIKNHKDLLNDKDEELAELFRLCDNKEQQDLVGSLLERFFFLDGKHYGTLLADMAKYIKSLEYPIDKTVVLAMAIDDKPDSSQEVLQNLKVYLAKEFDKEIKQCNSMSDLNGLYNRGYRHFIVVDEFVGSGKTIRSRFKNRFNKIKVTSPATIIFCILTGMDKAVNELVNEGVPIKVFHRIERGISDFYIGKSLTNNIAQMYALESKLADSINGLKLSDYSFGYKKSEAIYYKENGNIPNNVFPIFWWKKYKNSTYRNTLFTRVQDGY